MANMSAKLSPKTETKLVEALQKDELIAREIRAITNWDGTHMSIKNAVASVARRNNMRMHVRKAGWEIDGVTRKMLTYRLAAKKSSKAA